MKSVTQRQQAEQLFQRARFEQQQGDFSKAFAGYQQVLEVEPGHAEAWRHCGLLAHQLGDSTSGAALLAKAVALQPDSAIFRNNLGVMLEAAGQAADAVQAYQQALALNPTYAEAHSNLGNLLSCHGELEAAAECYRQAIRFKPTFADAHYNLGRVLAAMAKPDEAVAAYRHALKLKPDFPVAYSNMLFALQYSLSTSLAEIYAEHRRYAERFEAPLKRDWKPHGNAKEPGKRIRLGYVSPDFCNHSVAYFIEPILSHHDHTCFEVYCYYTHTQQDFVTERLRGTADHWLDCAALSDADLAARIRADGIDILVDLTGHTARNRLLTFARKPAPVQVTWIGYVGTTGLDAMDYRLTDANMDPEGYSDRYHSEKLVRLSSVGLVELENDAPDINPLPALSGAPFTYACLNGHGKISDANLKTWAELLKRHPGSRMMFGYAEAEATRTSLTQRLERYGVAAERLVFQPRMEKRDYLALHHQIDLALDPYPYNGGTTTRYSLWMGVPVVTLAGDRSVARCGVRNLKYVDLPECVAEDEADYVEKALSLAHDLPRLNAIRQSLRARIARQPASDAQTYTREVEAAYRKMWETWCANGNDAGKERGGVS